MLGLKLIYVGKRGPRLQTFANCSRFLVTLHHWNRNVMLNKMFITGCTESCWNDNFQCCQWRTFCQHDIYVSVMYSAWWMTRNIMNHPAMFTTINGPPHDTSDTPTCQLVLTGHHYVPRTLSWLLCKNFLKTRPLIHSRIIEIILILLKMGTV